VDRGARFSDTCENEEAQSEVCPLEAGRHPLGLAVAPGAVLFGFRGNSMYPLLDERDILEVVPYAGQPVAMGDVILFEPPGRAGWTVHRVTQVTPQGIRTRGDNNTTEDEWSLSAADLRGRVVAAWRGARRRPIAGGRAGQLIAVLLHARLALDRGLARLGRPLYRMLAGRGWLARCLPPGWRPRPVAFQAPEGTRLRLVLGRRVVGQYDPERRRWLIRRPYRLLVDETSLPHPGE